MKAAGSLPVLAISRREERFDDPHHHNRLILASLFYFFGSNKSPSCQAGTVEDLLTECGGK
jgi:hypothetical protein